MFGDKKKSVILMKPGSVVRLKGGGEVMTVEQPSDEWVWCTWMVNGEAKRDKFRPQQLDVVKL